jgi:hypothetical protein
MTLAEEVSVLPALVVSLGLFQYGVDPVRGAEIAQAIVNAEPRERAREAATRSEAERRRFEDNFNRLVAAIDEFQREYNASGGHVWPKKKADALKKAIKDLQLR